MVELEMRVVSDLSSSDVEMLHKMVVESTDSKTSLTLEDLRKALRRDNPSQASVEPKFPEIYINKYQLETDAPACQAFLAKVENLNVGYIIFHYHYSPWLGHTAAIDDVFVERQYRRKGVARSLVEAILTNCRQERMSMITFMVTESNRDVIKSMEKRHNLRWVRNDETDWSVYKLNLT